jgi:C4-dicarboxylate-specific signal transduction histidine kinase
MHDFGSLLTVVISQVAAAVLVMSWLRSRTPMSFAWALGWLLVVSKLSLQLSGADAGVAGQVAGDCSIQIAALIFLDSINRVYLGSKAHIPMAYLCALPIALFTAGTHYLPGSVPAIPFFLTMLVLAAVGGGFWALRSQYVRKEVSLAVIAVATALVSRAVFAHQLDRGPNVILGVVFGMTGIAFLKRYSRGSTGSFLTVAGLFGNSLIMLLSQFPGESPEMLPKLEHGSEFLWILSAVGMIIVLMEEDARVMRDLQQREKRLREELQHYASVQVASQVEAGDDKIYLPACKAIADRSPFREVALLRRNARGEAEVMCYSELITANKAGIAAMTEQYSKGDPDLRLSFQGSRSVIVSTNEHRRRRNHKVPGRSMIVTLPSQSGKAQGWLWLASPRAGWSTIHADELLPLESLASRLAVSMENRELTRMLIRTDKLAGLGKLAGGVAHELNNPLTVVAGYAEIIHESTLEPSTRKQTAKILSEAMRMKRIIEDLNRFSQPPTAEYGAQNMVEVLTEVGQSLQTDLIRRGVSFELHSSGGTPIVYGCRDSLSQVFFQLIINSAEAMERADRDGKSRTDGRIRVDVDQKDGRVSVLVSDNGPGFAEPERVFDPFYTTKDPGEGPGLGLSVSYGLIQEHQGDIHAYNLQPRGAAVNVILPSAPAEVMQMPAPHRVAGLPVASLPVAIAQSA